VFHGKSRIRDPIAPRLAVESYSTGLPARRKRKQAADGDVQSGPGFVASTVYIKVPVGTLKVTFADGIVEALDESEGTLGDGQVSVVVPPINVYW